MEYVDENDKKKKIHKPKRSVKKMEKPIREEKYEGEEEIDTATGKMKSRKPRNKREEEYEEDEEIDTATSKKKPRKTKARKEDEYGEEEIDAVTGKKKPIKPKTNRLDSENFNCVKLNFCG